MAFLLKLIFITYLLLIVGVVAGHQKSLMGKAKNNHTKASEHVPAEIETLRKLKAKPAPKKSLKPAIKEQLGHDLTFVQVYKKLKDGSWEIQKQPKETSTKRRGETIMTTS